MSNRRIGTAVALGDGIGGISHRCEPLETKMSFFVSNLNRAIVGSFGAMLVTVLLTAAAAGPAVV